MSSSCRAIQIERAASWLAGPPAARRIRRRAESSRCPSRCAASTSRRAASSTETSGSNANLIAPGEAFRAPARRESLGQLAERVHANLRRIRNSDGGWLLNQFERTPSCATSQPSDSLGKIAADSTRVRV